MTTKQEKISKEFKKHNVWLKFASKCKLSKETKIMSIPSLLSECRLTNDACTYENCPLKTEKILCPYCPFLIFKYNKPYCNKLHHSLENGFAMQWHYKRCGEQKYDSST